MPTAFERVSYRRIGVDFFEFAIAEFPPDDDVSFYAREPEEVRWRHFKPDPKEITFAENLRHTGSTTDYSAIFHVTQPTAS